MSINTLLASNVFGTIGTVIIALLVLLATITVHEFGHYIIGKLFKFKINEFSIGMGPAIYKKKKKNGEIFAVRAFPLGGYCAFEGEDEEAEANKDGAATAAEGATVEAAIPDAENGESVEKQTDTAKKADEGRFNSKKPWQRLLVLFAGGTFNLIFAVLIIALNFSCFGHFGLSAAEMRPAVDENVAFSEYSLQNDDVIVSVDGKYLYLTTDLTDALNNKKRGDIVKVEVERGGKRTNVEVMLRADVSLKGMDDITPALKALGVATVPSVSVKGISSFKDGDYLFRFNDKEVYTDCTRIYDAESFVKYVVGVESRTIEVWVPTTQAEKNKIEEENKKNGTSLSTARKTVTLVMGEDWAAVDKTDKEAVLKYFGIENVSISYQMYSKNVRMSFGEILYRPTVYMFKTIGVTFRAVGQLFSGQLSITTLSGPVSTISLTAEYVSYGFNYILEIAAFIGISVGIFNLLPIPALDGGKSVFVIIEWIRKKPINRKIEAIIHTVGFVALLLFAVFVDAIKLFI